MFNCYLIISDKQNNTFKYLNFQSNLKYSKNDSVYLEVIEKDKSITSRIFDIDLVLVLPIKKNITYFLFDKEINIKNCDIIYIVKGDIDFLKINSFNNNHINF